MDFHSEGDSKENEGELDPVQELLLENLSTQEIESQAQLVDNWIDEIQENASIDVPIVIFFCTKRKKSNFIEKILADRDQHAKHAPGDSTPTGNKTDRSGNKTDRSAISTDEDKGERIDQIIQ